MYRQQLAHLAEIRDVPRSKTSRVLDWLSQMDSGPPATIAMNRAGYDVQIHGLFQMPWEILSMVSLFILQECLLLSFKLTEYCRENLDHVSFESPRFDPLLEILQACALNFNICIKP